MSVWRLEWLRLTRTRRLVALAGVYGFLGIVGPLTARYLGEIIDRFGGGDITVVVPEAVPADGIAQYVANASQIGLLVAIAVAAGALTLDAIPEMSIFLRTRIGSGARLVLPRYTVAVVAVGGAYALGLALAWYETAVLLGSVAVVDMVAGLVLAVVYLGFAVAVTAAAGAMARSVLGTVGVSLVALLVLPIIGIAETIGRWLPSHLVGSQVGLLTGDTLSDYAGAALVALASAAALVALAVHRAGAREL